MAKATATATSTSSMIILSGAALLLVAQIAVGCGGSGGGSRGVGGSTGSGGSVVIPGIGGSTGTGGMTVGLNCATGSGVDPAAPLLVDFSSATWSSTLGKWNTLNRDLTGSKYSAGSGRANPDGGSMVSVITNAIDSTASNPNFELKGNVLSSADFGFGLLSFDKCVNTTQYTGIQFTLGGTAAGCDFTFQIQTFDQQATSNRGGCTASCYHFPQKKIAVPATPTTVAVHFSELAGTGMPDTADGIRAQIVGLQWQFQTAAGGDAGQVSCDGIDVTIDDVGFTTD